MVFNNGVSSTTDTIDNIKKCSYYLCILKMVNIKKIVLLSNVHVHDSAEVMIVPLKLSS